MYRQTIKEYQLGIDWRRGQIAGLLRPRSYWVRIGSGRSIEVFDTRATNLRVAGQEVILGDRTSLKVNVAGIYKIQDPTKLVREVPQVGLPDYLNQLIQLRLRDILATKSLDDLLEHRADVNKEFTEVLRPSFDKIGLDLVEIRLKDIILPSDLRAAYTDALAASLRAKAQLEQARGQSAALRNLANTADLLEKHPQLVQLMSLQKDDANLNLYFEQTDRSRPAK